MINRSNTAVRRAVESRDCHVWGLWAMTALCVLSFSPPSRAGECHTQDRPVISDTLSWEIDAEVALS
jgi:hypothetical protein